MHEPTAGIFPENSELEQDVEQKGLDKLDDPTAEQGEGHTTYGRGQALGA